MKLPEYFVFKTGHEKHGTEIIIELIDNPDVVPVVRCKDCKHRDPEDKKCDCGHDILWQLPRDDDWFCANGEKVTE